MIDFSTLAGQLDVKREIEELIQRKDAAGEPYSEQDKVFIAQYDGAGGIKGATGRGVLDEFYTPDYVCALMFELCYKHGFTKGERILEPSCATGRFFNYAPAESPKTGFELNPVSFRIAQILHPDVELHNLYFEQAFLEPGRFASRARKPWIGEDYGLVIGNPPYGVHNNFYADYFKNPKVHQIENFFMYYGLKVLKKNGLLCYLTSSNFLRTAEKNQEIKKEMGKLCELVVAFQLPPVFKNSKVPTDILIFRKR